MKVEISKIDADLFLKLYTSVGWEAPRREQVEKALQNTRAVFTAYDEETPAGMARLIGDGGMSFYLKGFAVIPRPGMMKMIG